ncbi:MAG: hypothetical protein LGR52_05100 [Candidatus Thiosymbion ectosymbiont of Robbea hypermnestra]|nr:hypothetical protein [Candidatus Thiosymbion ectosymbiont of Robbea hypermnestra]
MNDTNQTQKSNRPTGGQDTDEWSIERFECWLRVGVESYVLEGAGAAAFPAAAHRILTAGSLSQGLREFAAGLNAVRRDNLKQALAQVLSSLEPQERFVSVAEQLLAVAVAISAYPVLKVLARKIGGGFFGQPDAEGRDSLFAMTLYSVARLATPGHRDAEHCLNELIKSENFRPAHASTVLLALCQVDPQGLVRHLSKSGLRERLAEQFAIYDPDGSVCHKVAQDVLAIVGLDDLKDALYGLDVLDPSACGVHPDDWLVEFLVFAPDTPLKVAESDGEMKLCSRTTPT